MVPRHPVQNACRLTCNRFRLSPFRSPLLRASLSISLPPVTEMFHFTGSPPEMSGHKISPVRFPHSDTHGSMDAYSSPWLFAVRCVLRRHLAPRHPPRALITLTSYFPYNTPLPNAYAKWLWGFVMVQTAPIRAKTEAARSRSNQRCGFSLERR